MLTEYTIDTKEEKLFPSSIELRKRFAGRKLEKAIESGAVTDETLIKIKDMNRNELDEHSHEKFTISMTGITAKVAVARAEQQLIIEGKLRLLDRDLHRTSKLGKSRIDSLSDLETRINLMRHRLRDSTPSTVDQDIRKDLEITNKAKVEKQFTICPRCQRRLLKNLCAAHDSACAKIGGKWNQARDDIYDVNVNHVVATATFNPQPPRNAAVKSKGCTFIEWTWEPPVSDGGLAVTEYELSYIVRISELNHVTGKYDKSVEVVPSLRTSHWALCNPICHTGYKMVGLRGGAEYTDFQMRCRNLRGWSDWVYMVGTEVIKLDEPDSSSPPLFVRYTKITSSCIHLEWDPPFYDGGQEIVEYVVYYIVMDRHISATSRDIFIARDCKFKAGTALSAVIRNIPADTKVRTIGVKAINKAQLTSEMGYLLYNPNNELSTSQCSRHTLLVRTLDEAMASKDAFMDTDIFQVLYSNAPME